MPKYKTIQLSRADGVAQLRLDRPGSLNALTKEVIAEVGAALDDVRTSADRCLLLSGNGRAFCAGADLSGGNESSHPLGALGEVYNRVFEALANFEKPTVCAVHGACAGAGVSFALSCDIVIAADSAYFLQAFVNAGLVPDTGASWLLPRAVGRARAFGMSLLGKRITAAQAADWGLVWEVVRDAQLDPQAFAIARQLAEQPPGAVRATKALLRESGQRSYADQLVLEAQLQHKAEHGDEHRQAVAAFFEKRSKRPAG